MTGFPFQAPDPRTNSTHMFMLCSVLFSYFWGLASQEKSQMACKPGSVRRSTKVKRVIAIHLGPLLPMRSCNRPGRRVGNATNAAPIWFCSRWGLPCRPCCQARGALLPHPFTLTHNVETVWAVCFLWHFPWGRPRRALPGTVFPWSPDFPPPHLTGAAAIRPSDGA